MNEKLQALKKLLDSTEGNGSLLVPIEDLREMITVIEAVTAPNMRLALERFEIHIAGLQARLHSQVESINRLLTIAEEARNAARSK